MDATIITALIVASFSFITAVVTGIFQLRTQKSQSKKTDVDSYAILIKTATDKTKTEVDILKDVIAQLNSHIINLQADIKRLEEEKAKALKEAKEKEESLNLVILELEARLEDCERKFKHLNII